MKTGLVKKLLGRMFRSRHHDPIPVYLSRFEPIDKLVKAGSIAIDLESCYVALDVSVHICHMNSDSRYAAFFDTLRAYINFHRGMLGLPMIQPEERVNFSVMLRLEHRFDMETGEFFDTPQHTNQVWLVGYSQSGSVHYAAYESPEKSAGN